MEPVRISDRIYHYPAIEMPLAADVGVVEGNTYTWLFDLGPHAAALQALQSFQALQTLRTPQTLDPAMPLCLALSHFHQDHIAGFDQLRVLRSLRAPYFLLSHDDPFVHHKEEVIAELEAIYARRQSQSMYIEI